MSVDVNDSQHRMWKSRLSAARMAYREGKLADAERLARRALFDAEQMHDSQYPVSVSLNYVAIACIASGRFSEAEDLLKKAERISKSGDGPEFHQVEGSTLRHMGQLKVQQKKYDDAEDLYQRALDALQKSLPEGTLELANCLCDMATMYLLQGQYSAAEPTVVEALKIYNSGLPSSVEGVDRASFIYEACANREDDQRLDELFEDFATKAQYELGPKNPTLVRALRLYAEHLKGEGNQERLASLSEQFSALKTI